MQANELIISLPASLEESVHATREEIKEQVRLMAALKMFELGKLSSGTAAELAGLTRTGFFEACARYRVSVFNYPTDAVATEIKRDLQSATEAATE